jgi:gamma-glutamylcyclotransferase (GGCT)/AIG2-like uncharacterized protein YtfP
MEKEDHLFVYGTLCQRMKHPLSHLLVHHGIFIGKGIFQGKLYDLGRYPGAVPSWKKSDFVTGEIYRLENPKQVFDILDEYEGPRFKRTQVTIFFGEDTRLLCWIYLYTHSISGRRIILGGDYVRYRNGS